MTALDTEQQLLDMYGIPEYYTTHAGLIEDAGDGVLRVVRCVMRNGGLQPVYSALAPASRIIATCENMRIVAERILRGHSTSH